MHNDTQERNMSVEQVGVMTQGTAIMITCGIWQPQHVDPVRLLFKH